MSDFQLAEYLPTDQDGSRRIVSKPKEMVRQFDRIGSHSSVCGGRFCGLEFSTAEPTHGRERFKGIHDGVSLDAATARLASPGSLGNPFVHSLLVTLGNHAVRDVRTYNWPCPDGHLQGRRLPSR